MNRWVVLAVLVWPVAAFAHAFLDHAEPRVGAEVTRPPPTLTLVFTEPIELAFSRVTVTGPGGEVTAGAVEQPAPETVQLALPPLGPGRYTVRWMVVSVDTHTTSGKFEFAVKTP